MGKLIKDADIHPSWRDAASHDAELGEALDKAVAAANDGDTLDVIDGLKGLLAQLDKRRRIKWDLYT